MEFDTSLVEVEGVSVNDGILYEDFLEVDDLFCDNLL